MKEKSKTIKLGNKRVKRDSPLGRIIEKSAKAKNQSEKQFIEKGGKEILFDLQKGLKSVDNRSIDDIIKMIEKKAKYQQVFVNEVSFTDTEAIFELENFKNEIKRISKTIMQILMDYESDLDGNFYLTIPEIPQFYGKKPRR